MSALTLSNPYAAILSAIWGIMIKITQATANSLGGCLVPFTQLRDVTHEYNIDGGAANPLGLLHPKCREGGVAV